MTTAAKTDLLAAINRFSPTPLYVINRPRQNKELLYKKKIDFCIKGI